MEFECNMCGLEYDTGEWDSCPRCNPEVDYEEATD